MAAALVAGVVIVVVTAVFVRVDRVQLAETPHAAAGSVFLIIGSDSGISRPEGDPQTAGERADVVLLVHVGARQTNTVVLPRDLLVEDARGVPMRLALTMSEGVPAVAAALCRSVGIAPDHAVALDGKGFVSAVDALDGVSVDVPAPVRDPAAGLLIESPGLHRLSGEQALAFVRSRHPEFLSEGAWTGGDDGAGASARLASTERVAQALAAAVRDADPAQLATAVWEASDDLTISNGTTLADLHDLSASWGAVSVLPTERVAVGYETTNDESARALRSAGFTSDCRGDESDLPGDPG